MSNVYVEPEPKFARVRNTSKGNPGSLAGGIMWQRGGRMTAFRPSLLAALFGAVLIAWSSTSNASAQPQEPSQPEITSSSNVRNYRRDDGAAFSSDEPDQARRID